MGLVLAQMSFSIILQLFLSIWGVPWIPSCSKASLSLKQLSPDSPINPDVEGGGIPVGVNLLFAMYVFLASMGLSSFNSRPWLLAGSTVSLLYLIVYSISDARYCLETPLLRREGFESLNGIALLSVNRTSAGYGLLQWVCTLTVTLIMLTLTFMTLRESIRGTRPLNCDLDMEVKPIGVNSGNSKEVVLNPLNGINERVAAPPAQVPQEAPAEEKSQADFLSDDFLDPTQSTEKSKSIGPKRSTTEKIKEYGVKVLDRCQEASLDALQRFLETPLRHIVACFFSSVALLILSSSIVGWSSYIQALARLFRDKTLPQLWESPGFQELLSDPDYGGIAATIKSIASSLVVAVHDIAQYLPIGIWCVFFLYLGVIWHSVYPVSEQVRWLQCRYSSAAANNWLPPKEPTLDRISAPALPHFNNFGASVYLFSHLVGCLLAYFLAIALVVVVVTFYVIQTGSFEGALKALAALFWAPIASTIVKNGPKFVYWYVLYPIASLLGGIAAKSLKPIRIILGWSECCTRGCSDGPYVIAPRLLLFADGAFTFLLGPFLGTADALSRVLVGIVWGLIRLAQFHEPLIPQSVYFLDRPFTSYGASLRMSSLDILDDETVPPAKGK